MNIKQEKALFGNVLFSVVRSHSGEKRAKKLLGIHNDLTKEEFNVLLSLTRSQREAIGALIQQCRFHEDFIRRGNTELYIDEIYRRDIDIILSAVIQDTWEEVRKVWEENQ